MRTLILHFLDTKNTKHLGILKNLEKSAVANGHQVDIFNGNLDSVENLHPVVYEYIAVVTTPPNFIGAKLPPKLTEILSSSGNFSGKKGCAFVVKSGLSSNKTVHLLMKELEKQGMCLDYFDIIESIDHAAASGKKIG